VSSTSSGQVLGVWLYGSRPEFSKLEIQTTNLPAVGWFEICYLFLMNYSGWVLQKEI